jgi:hypothetical protein
MIVYISLFYAKSHWNIIAKPILKAMQSLEKQKLLRAFNIIFGTERGENISLVIYSHGAEAKEKITTYLHHYFEEFFLANPSPDALPDSQIRTLFMHFPNNSIQYNLYKNEFVTDSEEPDFDVLLFDGLARIFLSFLSRKEYKNWIEEPATGLFIMQILLMRAFGIAAVDCYRIYRKLYLTVNDELSYYDTLYDGSNASKAAIPEKTLKEEFNRNEVFLTGMLEDLLYPSEEEFILDDVFYNSYYRLCLGTHDKYLETKGLTRQMSARKYRDMKNWLIGMVRSQFGFLGIPPVNELLVFYFLKRSYQSCLDLQYA